MAGQDRSFSGMARESRFTTSGRFFRGVNAQFRLRYHIAQKSLNSDASRHFTGVAGCEETTSFCMEYYFS